MRKIIFLSIFSTTILFLSLSLKAIDNLPKKGARCTGSAYCSACSNCSRCGHCSSGGTCGVCSGSPSSIDYSSVKKHQHTTKTSKKSRSKSQGKVAKVDFPNTSFITVNASVINIRKQASLKSIVIEKAQNKTRLTKLQTLKSWYKVKVEKTGTVGYVYFKDLK